MKYQNTGVPSSLDVVAVRSLLFSWVSAHTLCNDHPIWIHWDLDTNPDWMVVASVLTGAGLEPQPFSLLNLSDVCAMDGYH